MKTYDKETISDLIDGNLKWKKVKEIISSEKDADRFEKVVEILQERLGWKEKIVLPLSEHLYIVEKNKKYIIKCDCGYEFCDYRENFKTKCKVILRDSVELMEEIYPPYMHSDPELMELREYCCPGCFTLLEIEAVPPGYPVIFNFLPDLESLYEPK
ncbi:MAG: acetone carboxylase subunit gamma [Candidatus Helarchaeota archaeon]|nr:acetone carboxylase subunit gamma [Candidatus Helarchaeota archaeon]